MSDYNPNSDDPRIYRRLEEDSQGQQYWYQEPGPSEPYRETSSYTYSGTDLPESAPILNDNAIMGGVDPYTGFDYFDPIQNNKSSSAYTASVVIEDMIQSGQHTEISGDFIKVPQRTRAYSENSQGTSCGQSENALYSIPGSDPGTPGQQWQLVHNDWPIDREENQKYVLNEMYTPGKPCTPVSKIHN